jgi:hypothetical protein
LVGVQMFGTARRPPHPPDDSRLVCSFCGKAQPDVRKLIAGPKVNICNECVEVCNKLLDDPHAASVLAGRAKPT